MYAEALSVSLDDLKGDIAKAVAQAKELLLAEAAATAPTKAEDTVTIMDEPAPSDEDEIMDIMKLMTVSQLTKRLHMLAPDYNAPSTKDELIGSILQVQREHRA